MSTTPQKEETAQEEAQQQEQEQEQEQEREQSPSQSQEKQTQDTETEEEEKSAQTSEKEEEKPEEEVEDVPGAEKKKMKTPAKAASPTPKKSPSQAASASKSATKRKFDALHARNTAGEASIYEHEKTKKARASELMKTPATKPNGNAKKSTKTREFSFARPTASSARRTAAAADAKNQAHVKATPMPTPPPSRKPLHAKHTPAKAQRASTPAPKTPATTGADKASRPHFSYTPYTGPLPPLTVESSFAPKNAQGLDRGARTASPAKTKMAAAARKPRPASAKKAQPPSTPGKENNGVNTEEDAATNAASTSRTPVKSSKTGSPVNKEENRSAFKEKIKTQRSLAQQAGRTSPVSMEPTV